MTRTARRTASVLALTLVTLVVTSPTARAVIEDDGDQPGPAQPIGETLLLFVVVPLAICLVIGLLVYAPSLARGPRYRPGLSWWAAPVWFNGPGDAPGQHAGDAGAHRGETPTLDAGTSGSQHAPAEPAFVPSTGGGASASW